MASVWVARLVRKHGFEKLVAIKTILPKYAEDETFQKMFFDEARIASRIDHVNVGHIHDLGEEDNILYLVMEWIDGDALTRLRRSIIKSGSPFPVDVALRIIADVLSGLHAAHELRGNDGGPLGVVHRDVSPQNILVTVEGIAKLIDFGVAKARDRLVEETNTGFVKGKVQYMAPEQALGKVVDRRADLWAVGAVLYHLVAGKPPFDADNQLAMLHVLTSGKKPTALPPRIPTKVAEVIETALQHDLDKRYQSAIEMKNAIERTNLAATTDQVAECLRTFLGEQAEARRHALSVALHTADTRANMSAVSTSSVSHVRGVPAATTGSDSGVAPPPIHPVVNPGSSPPVQTEDGSLSVRATQPLGGKTSEPSSPSNPSAPGAMRDRAGSDPTIDKAAPTKVAPTKAAPTAATAPPSPRALAPSTGWNPDGSKPPTVPRMPPPLPSSRPKIAAEAKQQPAVPPSAPKIGASRPAPPPPPPPPSDPMPGSQPPMAAAAPHGGAALSPISPRQQSSPFIPIAAPAPIVPGSGQHPALDARQSSPQLPVVQPQQQHIQAPQSQPQLQSPQSQPQLQQPRHHSQPEILAPTVPLPPLGATAEEINELPEPGSFDRTELMITPPLNPPPTPAEPATGGESLGLASISSSVAMPKPAAKSRRGLLIGALVGFVLLMGAAGTTLTLTRGLKFGQPAFSPTFSPLPPPMSASATTATTDTPPPTPPTDPTPTTTTTAVPMPMPTPTTTAPPAPTPSTTTTTTTTTHKQQPTPPPPTRTGVGTPPPKKLPPPPPPTSSTRKVDDGF
jgi:eukaryotic-like serine/threonine-protein kinase